MNNSSQALALLLAHSPSITEHMDYYAMIAAIYEKLNQPLHAAQIYRDLVSIAPDNGLYWVGLGLSLEKMNKSNEALYAYQRAVKAQHLKPGLASFVESRIRKLQI